MPHGRVAWYTPSAMSRPGRPLSFALVAASAALLGLTACSGGGGGGGDGGTVKRPPFIGKANSFNDVTKHAGLVFPPSKNVIWANGAGAASGDYDNDGFVDILVLRDAKAPALLFRNKGDGRLRRGRARQANLVIEGNTLRPLLRGHRW